MKIINCEKKKKKKKKKGTTTLMWSQYRGMSILVAKKIKLSLYIQ
jgi:hypothetical protein